MPADELTYVRRILTAAEKLSVASLNYVIGMLQQRVEAIKGDPSSQLDEPVEDF